MDSFSGAVKTEEPPSNPLEEIQTMDDYAFEHFVAAIWEHYGFECEVSQASNDDGIDVRAVNSNADPPQKHLIQAKRYGPKSWVRGPEVQQYSALYRHEPGVTEVHVVTSNDFTEAAYRHAERYGVHLSRGENIVNTVQEIKDETGVALLGTVAGPSPPSIELSWIESFGSFFIGGTGVWLVLLGIIGMAVSWFQFGIATVAISACTVLWEIAMFLKGKSLVETSV